MDTQRLRELITQTPWVIERYREAMLKGGVGYDEVPVFSGFGPKSPLDEGMQGLADIEAAYIGALARHCITQGTIPPIPLKGFWWIKGQCRGIKNSVETIMPTIYHLKAYAPEVLDTEGIDGILEGMETIRETSLKIFPNEDNDWIELDEAMRLTGRSERTLRLWRENGWVECLNDNWGVMYSKAGIMQVLKIKEENMHRGKSLEK